MRSLGFDPQYMSSEARLAEEKAGAPLKTMTQADGLNAKAAELNAIENIIRAETKDHADWEMLGKIARQADDSQIRDVLKPAVSEVEPEEDDHANWTKTEMARRALNALENRPA
jgi:hypothetical protein